MTQTLGNTPSVTSVPITTVDDAVEAVGLGRFQWRLLGLSGLVWAGDAMEVIGVGFIIASVAATFSLTGSAAGLVGSLFFAGMFVGAFVIGKLFGRRKLAPQVSPNKTLEGAFGGLGLAVVIVSGTTYALELVYGLQVDIYDTLLFSVLVSSAASATFRTNSRGGSGNG